MAVIDDEIRKLIAEALYPISANQLPEVCERFGLAPGERAEAFASKRSYVLARLNRLPREQLLRTAREVAEDYPCYRLSEALAKIEAEGRPTLSELIRRKIGANLARLDYPGPVPFFEMIRRVWPIDQMESPHYEGATLADTIDRHMGRNDDWDLSDLFEALGLYSCSQQRFFAFLEAVVHPTGREPAEQKAVVDQLNVLLRRDGYALLPTGRMSGYSVYTVQEVVPVVGQPADLAISATLEAFDPASVHAAWVKALDRRGSDPEGAITAARTLLETVCKHIIEDAGGGYSEKDDLPKLYRAAAIHLNLAPDQHTETVFKAILGNCQSIVVNLGTLRNRLSDSHGKGRKPVRPKARHAELAVNLAGSVAMFLVATWNARQTTGL